jgi:hypothetical protein
MQIHFCRGGALAHAFSRWLVSHCRGPDHSMLDFWSTEGHWEKFFSLCFGFHFPVWFCQSPVLVVHLPLTALWSKTPLCLCLRVSINRTCLRCVIDEVAVRQAFLWTLQLCPVSSIPPVFSTHLHLSTARIRRISEKRSNLQTKESCFGHRGALDGNVL